MTLRLWQCQIILMLLQNCHSRYYKFGDQMQYMQVQNPIPFGQLQQQLQPLVQFQQPAEFQQPLLESRRLYQPIQFRQFTQMHEPIQYFQSTQIQPMPYEYDNTYNMYRPLTAFPPYREDKYTEDDDDDTDDSTEDTDDSIECMCECNECYSRAECCLEYCLSCPPLVPNTPTESDLVIIPYAVPVVIYPNKSVGNKNNDTMVENKTETTSFTSTSETTVLNTETTEIIQTTKTINVTDTLPNILRSKKKTRVEELQTNVKHNFNEKKYLSDDNKITEDEEDLSNSYNEISQYQDTIKIPDTNATRYGVKPKYYLIAEYPPQNIIFAPKRPQNMKSTQNPHQNMEITPSHPEK